VANHDWLPRPETLVFLGNFGLAAWKLDTFSGVVLTALSLLSAAVIWLHEGLAVYRNDHLLDELISGENKLNLNRKHWPLHRIDRNSPPPLIALIGWAGLLTCTAVTVYSAFFH